MWWLLLPRCYGLPSSGSRLLLIRTPRSQKIPLIDKFRRLRTTLSQLTYPQKPSYISSSNQSNPRKNSRPPKNTTHLTWTDGDETIHKGNCRPLQQMKKHSVLSHDLHMEHNLISIIPRNVLSTWLWNVHVLRTHRSVLCWCYVGRWINELSCSIAMKRFPFLSSKKELVTVDVASQCS